MSFNNKTVQNEFQELAARPVIAIVGTDRFCSGRRWSDCFRRPRAIEAWTRFGWTAASATPAEVLDEVRTPSLLGDRRMVIVDDADELIEGNRKTLERYCSDPAAEGCLVLLCRSLPRNTNLYKVIAKLGGFMQVEPPAGRDIVPWIVRRASEVHGSRMNHAAAERLQEHIGDAPGLLDAELGKLATYAGGARRDHRQGRGRSLRQPARGKSFRSCGRNRRGRRGDGDSALATGPGNGQSGGAQGHRWVGVRRRRITESLPPPRPRTKRGHDAGRGACSRVGSFSRQLGWASTSRMQRMQRDLLEADVAIKTGLSSPAIAIESSSSTTWRRRDFAQGLDKRSYPATWRTAKARRERLAYRARRASCVQPLRTLRRFTSVHGGGTASLPRRSA